VLSIWNFAGAKSLVIVTANSPTSDGQRVDIEILDGSERGNVYLSKKVGWVGIVSRRSFAGCSYREPIFRWNRGRLLTR
jgi:hypothetical protein